MSDAKPPFDLIRFACYLVAGVVGAYAIDLLIGLVACAYRSAVGSEPACGGQLSELLATLLATVVAFASGLLRTPPPKKPDDEGGSP